MADDLDLLRSLILDVPDFPKQGVMFKDITPLLASARGFETAINRLVTTAPKKVDVVVGMEARGFIFAAPVALALGAGFVPVRKPGKLPGNVVSETFALEYGTETLTVHANALQAGQKVLIVDDVLATGGTVAATAKLLQGMHVEIVGISVLLELGFLNGRKRLAGLGVPDPVALLQA